MNILYIYNKLYASFGKQGWWPLTLDGFNSKHHVGSPKNDRDRLEIIFGAILTQNTNWKNVEKALFELNKNKLIYINKIKKINNKKLAELVKSSGYHNQKAERLKIVSEFFNGKFDYFLKNKNINELRTELLNVKGIGPETADSILLYAFQKPIFVVDAYTKRIFSRLGFNERNYDEIQELFMNGLKKDHRLFNEYHALLVELGKNYCKSKNPKCNECPLMDVCENSKSD